jgi:hypothetical protein
MFKPPCMGVPDASSVTRILHKTFSVLHTLKEPSSLLGATDEVVPRPKGILVGLAGSSRLCDAVRGDFLELCHIQDLSPATPHPDDIGDLDSFVELGFHFVSPQMSFINLGKKQLSIES